MEINEENEVQSIIEKNSNEENADDGKEFSEKETKENNDL